ncbi:MAG: DUF1579 domain-containing protein [Oligoflexia bacterium]|nr:DUF1579 domain-containing protein [Oligoflexia bacterium]
MKKILLSCLCLFVSSACAGRLHHAQPQTTPREPAMTKEQMMEKMMKLSTPGQEHTALQPLVGSWNVEVKSWEQPGGKPQISKGQSTNKWVLGKRFVQEQFNGKFMGQPFQGVGMLGFDNVKREYVWTWYDSMSTGYMQSAGNFTPGAKTLEMEGKFSCPMTEEEMSTRLVTNFVDKNHHTFEMYMRNPEDGHEFKTMEIHYKRKA